MGALIEAIKFELHLRESLRIEEAGHAEVTNDIALDTSPVANLRPQVRENDGIIEEKRPAEGNESEIVHTETEKNYPTDEGSGVDKCESHIVGLLLALGIECGIDRIERKEG